MTSELPFNALTSVTETVTAALEDAAVLVFQVQHADRPGADHAARDEGAAADHQRIDRVAIVRQRARSGTEPKD